MQYECLHIRDVTISEDKSIFTLFLRSSKTDPFRQGVAISFFANKFLCPVSCMWYYLVNIRKKPLWSDAPLFVDDKNNLLLEICSFHV